MDKIVQYITIYPLEWFDFIRSVYLADIFASIIVIILICAIMFGACN